MMRRVSTKQCWKGVSYIDQVLNPFWYAIEHSGGGKEFFSCKICPFLILISSSDKCYQRFPLIYHQPKIKWETFIALSRVIFDKQDKMIIDQFWLEFENDVTVQWKSCFSKKRSDLQTMHNFYLIFDTMSCDKFKITVANRGLYKNLTK